jgi:peptidoglycan/xylan/chitin deacetylase (PgdA/CDA1 family)
MKIVLTFDVERDIPDLLNTDFGLQNGIFKILDLLSEFHIKATFFCNGIVSEQFPEVISHIEKMGHEIGCHGLNHERMNKLSYDYCKKSIIGNRSMLKKLCPSSEINGFRAPYLKPPQFIFRLLADLKFKYDSSIKPKHAKNYPITVPEIREFHPLSIYPFFRIPLTFYFIRKWVLRQDLVVLFFHSWEAINIRKLLNSKKINSKLVKTLLFRPDRWINTGDRFIFRLKKFIDDALSKKVEFITLNSLIDSKQT